MARKRVKIFNQLKDALEDVRDYRLGPPFLCQNVCPQTGQPILATLSIPTRIGSSTQKTTNSLSHSGQHVRNL